MPQIKFFIWNARVYFVFVTDCCSDRWIRDAQHRDLSPEIQKEANGKLSPNEVPRDGIHG